MRGKVNPGEVLIKAVRFVEPKMLTGFDQKVRGQAQGFQRSSVADVAPPVERHNLTHAVLSTEHGKPAVSPFQCAGEEGEPQGVLMGLRAEDRGKSEGRSVIERIRVATSPAAQACRLPRGVDARESSANRPEAVMQNCRRSRKGSGWCCCHLPCHFRESARGE